MYALSLAVILLGFGPQPTTDGKTAHLSPRQKASLLQGKFRVLVPTYVPTGFKVTTAKIADRKDAVAASLTLTYKNAKTKGEFTVQMASDGLGDPLMGIPGGDTVEPNGHLSAKNPILGKVHLDYYIKGKTKLFNCTWMPASNKTYPRFAMIMGEGLVPSEGKRVLESLRWLK